MDVMFYAVNGRGMGHLNRCLVLAQAIREAEPSAVVRFAVQSPAAGIVSASGFEVVKLPDRRHPRGFFVGQPEREKWTAEALLVLLRSWNPTHLVVDFALNSALFEGAQRNQSAVIQILRKTRGDTLRRIAWTGEVRAVDQWWIPHDESQWPRSSLPRRIRSRATYLGPVARHLNLSAVGDVRARYAAPGEKLIVVTIGGGGFEESYATLQASIEMMQPLGRGIKLLVLYGPYYPNPIPGDSRTILHRRYEPRLLELMVAADVVICNAGYNTIQEVLVSGTPAVIVPLLGTGRDNQLERAKRVEADGRALVCSAAPGELRDHVQSILEQQRIERRAPIERGYEQLGRTLLSTL